MRRESTETPEQRAHRIEPRVRHAGLAHLLDLAKPGFDIVKRVVLGVYADGFLHAGNLAYLTLITLFPFFIVLAAVAQAIGQPDDATRAVQSMLVTLPEGVRDLIAAATREVLSARTGALLWLGAAVGLWTVTSFIETIRDILRRAYGANFGRPFWQYRLGSIAVTVGAIVLIMAAFSAQVFLTAIEELIVRFVPAAAALIDVEARWLVINLALFFGLFVVYWALAPARYRARRYPKWPGALFVTLWWWGALTLLPKVIAAFGGYALTYGSLAGVMVALLFFWVVGFGLVIGAHLNAALANPAAAALEAERDD